MSFGFGVSDIYVCAQLAYRLYDEFKQAPGDCQKFARELLLFHQVLLKTKLGIEHEIGHLSLSDQAALGACLDSCKELLYVQTLGAPMVPIDFYTHAPQTDILLHPSSDDTRFLKGLRQKIKDRKLALRIPKLQRAIAAHVEKLTAFNVLIVQSNQNEVQASQERIKECVVESHDLLVKSSAGYTIQLDSLSEHLEASQTRIEAQIQTILANQQTSRSPIMAHSLDASSPEGRQTWMELGRLLRNEGITPAMIQENRGILVNAMKTTLENQTLLAESTPQSYATAPEYHVDINTSSSITQLRKASYRSVSPKPSSMSLLGSAPPRNVGFADGFFERHGAAGSLNQKQNIEEGLESLLQGMTHQKSSWDVNRDEIEGIELDEVVGSHENDPTMDVKRKVTSLAKGFKRNSNAEGIEGINIGASNLQQMTPPLSGRYFDSYFETEMDYW